jgi:oligopeptidase A
MNPLLSTAPLPLFDQILPEHVAPAIEALLAKASEALETVTTPAFPSQWEAIARELDVATEKLGIAWGAVSHLKSVADTPELRAAYNAMLPAVTDFWTCLGADERLFAKYKAIDVQTLNTEQPGPQERHSQLRPWWRRSCGRPARALCSHPDQPSSPGSKIHENTLDATDAFSYYATAPEMAGVPEDVQQAALAAAQATARKATS